MGRSQRHKVYIQGDDIAGKGLSEGQPAIVYIRQNAASQTLTVPIGAPGGPLKGSSIAGYPPTTFPPPKGVLEDRQLELADTAALEDPGMELTDRGQFNLSGNPRFTDLPPVGTTEEPLEPPVEPPVDPVAPILDSINPTFVVAGSALFTLGAVGKDFTERAVIVFDNVGLQTTLVSETNLIAEIDPANATPNTQVEVFVEQDGIESSHLNFNFSAAEEVQAEEQSLRNFPIGPFDIVEVTDSGDKICFLVAPNTPIRVNDEILIEATGNTTVNSSYIVETVAFNENGVLVAVLSDEAVLPAPIANRGRLTITG